MVEWVRTGAGGRFDEIELEIGVNYVAITSQPSAIAERIGIGLGLSGSEMMAHPHALFGSVDGICEELERRREEYGISYVSIHDDHAVGFAPVVERLAGT
jgi:hypothetical protein